MANIMIVDDSSIIRQRLRMILEHLGHRIVLEVENGKEAVEFYDEKNIDLVTMDIEMPGINGIEVVRLIRERNPKAAIIMISSIEHRNRVFEAIKLGAKHYIVKPFTEEKVREVIHSVLGIDPTQEQQQSVQFKAKSLEQAPIQLTEKQESMVLKAERLESLPFELFHMDDRTILIIRRHITDMNVHILFSCLQGLLYYRKMKYVVEFWEPTHHKEGYRLLLEFIFAVRDKNGMIALVTDDVKYYAQLASKLSNGVFRSYKEIKW